MEGRMNMAKQREAGAAKHRETEDLRKHEIAKLKDEQWTTVEDVRWKRELERETRRTRAEFEHWSEMQQNLAQEETRKRMLNDEAVQAYNDKHRSKCKKKAVQRRMQKELDEKRAGHIAEKLA